MADRLKGKATIVTGAGKGIGRGIAQVFAAEGAKVLIADIDERAVQETAEDLGRSGAEAVAVRVDVSKAADAEAMARAAIERRDPASLAASLARIDGWLHRLLAGSPALPQKRRIVAELKALPLRANSPLAGTTLQQLRALRGQ